MTDELWHKFYCANILFTKRIDDSEAAAAKEGLLSKGYRVDYANAKPGTTNGNGNDNGGGNSSGRAKQEEFRSTQSVNGGIAVGGSENGDVNGSNEHDSMDNRYVRNFA